MFKKSKVQAIAAMLPIIFVSACGGGGSTATPSDSTKPADAAKAAVNNQPVTVKIAVHSGIVNDNDLKRFFIDPVKQKYPHITIERINVADKGMSLNELVAAGAIPDMVINYPYNLTDLTKLGIDYNMDELIKKNGIDLNRISPEYLESIKTVSGFNYYTGLPMTNNTFALFYNKDVFDRFGVPYPKDGMTWLDAIEVGKVMSRQDGGVTYRGLDPENIGRIVRQMGMDYSDSKTMKSTMINPNWKTMFEIGKAIYTIPGNEVSDVNGDYLKSFFSGTIAMTARVNVLDQLEAPTKQGLNWDLAQYPSIPGIPNVGGDVDPHMLVIPPTAKHRDAAILVAKAMTHDETQLLMVKTTARLSPLKSAANKEAFASEKPYLQGKRLDSIFKNHPIRSPMRTKYFGQTGPIAKEAFKAYVAGTIDLNTALRQADEKINAYLAGQAGK